MIAKDSKNAEPEKKTLMNTSTQLKRIRKRRLPFAPHQQLLEVVSSTHMEAAKEIATIN